MLNVMSRMRINQFPERLALAIIKHSPHKTQEQSDPLPGDHTGPAVSSFPPESIQDTTSPVSLAGSSSSSELNSPASNSMSSANPTLGDLLDKVFAVSGSLPDCTAPQTDTDRNFQEPLKNLNPFCLKLLVSSLSSTSSKAYRNVCNFIGHLFRQNYSPSTILPITINKLCDITDPKQAFVTKKILKGL